MNISDIYWRTSNDNSKALEVVFIPPGKDMLLIFYYDDFYYTSAKDGFPFEEFQILADIEQLGYNDRKILKICQSKQTGTTFILFKNGCLIKINFTITTYGEELTQVLEIINKENKWYSAQYKTMESFNTVDLDKIEFVPDFI